MKLKILLTIIILVLVCLMVTIHTQMPTKTRGIWASLPQIQLFLTRSTEDGTSRIVKESSVTITIWAKLLMLFTTPMPLPKMKTVMTLPPTRAECG